VSDNGLQTSRGSLVVVGTAINVVGQTTMEAVDCLRRADRVFYATPNPASELWLRRLNPQARTLQDCYAEGKPREKTYREMGDRIMEAVRGGMHVCAAFYGHPGVLVQTAHAVIKRARREGFQARMLPGVSNEDCLFADLGVDPGEEGCQSFEATDFLASRRRFDPSSVLILWQVGMLGEPSVMVREGCRPERLAVLARVLRKHYPARHPVILYEAAQYPLCDPVVQRTTLAKLPTTTVPPMTTLYVPPRPPRPLDQRIMRWFDEE
jgi:hypothetical protein